MRGYFAWHSDFSGRPLNSGPAPDGEQWFAMALFFASHRWGDGAGIFDYGAEARTLLHTMLHKGDEPGSGAVGSMFDRQESQVVFAPDGWGLRFTDPSYQLPAFYELWARWSPDARDRAFWSEAAQASRRLFQKAADPRTGLMPDYSNFDGTARVRAGHEDFRYDAWRTLSNGALDFAWWARDPQEAVQANRVLAFLAAQGPHRPDLYRLDGTPVSSDVDNPGLTAMAAAAALAADEAHGRPFVDQLWRVSLPEGKYRYYSGMLTMLGLLEVGGRFQAFSPRSAP
jgi:oligosaccharide reducing-end xylanase